ncbi:MAG: hypothetical protein LBF97_04895, partial [Elusimicrobiota bacterium]|nr:hypothetical protein [Elusimicrobiota bacterium]
MFGFLAKSQNTEYAFLMIGALEVSKEKFVEYYVIDIYKDILTDCYNNSISTKKANYEYLIFDSVLKKEQEKGLIT